MQSVARASIGSDCERYTYLHEYAPVLRCSQQPGQVLVQTVNHIPTCTSVCQSCDTVSSKGKYWFRLWIIYLPARVCASLAMQSAARASIGSDCEIYTYLHEYVPVLRCSQQPGQILVQTVNHIPTCTSMCKSCDTVCSQGKYWFRLWILYLPARVVSSLAMQPAARASIGSDCESYTYLHEYLPVLRCSQQPGQVLVQTVNHIHTSTSMCQSCDAVSSQGKYRFRLWSIYILARVVASLAMQSAARASIGSDYVSCTYLHVYVPVLRYSQQPGQVLVQTVNHIHTCTSMCQSCDTVCSQGKYWFRLWIIYLPARVCASLAIQSAARASIGTDCESYTYLREYAPVLRYSLQPGQVLVQTVNHIPTCTSMRQSCDTVSSQGKYWFRLWIIYLPARVCASLAMQSAARASIGSDCESCSKSTRSFIPVADDKACSSSGIILDNTTTCNVHTWKK